MGVQGQSVVQTDTPDTSSEHVSLLEGENIVAVAQPSTWNWSRGLIAGVITGFIGVYAVTTGEISAGLVLGGFSTVLFGYVHFARARSRYIITNQRVVKNVGLLRPGSEDMRITDVSGVSIARTVRQQFIMTGTIKVQSVGGDTPIVLRNFRDYKSLGQAIRTQQQSVEQRITATESVTLENGFSTAE